MKSNDHRAFADCFEGLFRRFPAAWKALLAAEPLTTEAPLAGDPSRSFRVRGLHVVSTMSRREEAEQQAGRVPEGAASVRVYGLGLFDLPQVLMNRSGLRELHAVVFCPRLLRTTLVFENKHGRSPAWLTDPRLSLELARNLPDEVQGPFAAAPADLALAEDAALPLRDAVLLRLSEAYELRRHQEREPMLQRSMAHHEARMGHDEDVASLFASRIGKRAVVAAGGPTLTDGLSWIQAHRDEVVLVAVSTALLPLQGAGITPDFVVVVDPKPVLVEHFQGLTMERFEHVSLVYTPSVQPAVVELWPGRRFATYLPQARFRAMQQRLPRGELFCGGTVTHAAVDLAVRMGAPEVVLWGADFAYLEGRSHAELAPQERGLPDQQGMTVTTGDGKRAVTDLSLIGFLRELEGYIRRTPEVRFVTGNRRGAAIAGAVSLSEMEASS